MRKVEARRFSDYFRRRDAEEDYSAGFSWDRFFYKNRARFNRQWVLIFIHIGFLFIALSDRIGWILFLTGSLSLTALFLRTRAIAHGVYISRILPARSKEHEILTTEYEVRNASEFRIEGLIIRDFFTGTRDSLLMTEAHESIDPLTVEVLKIKTPCNAGMGLHQWGPLTATITDPFGVFEFTLTDDSLAPFEVLPEYLTLDHFEILESVDSAAIGMNESIHSGHSSNFLGLREYVPGDPIKRINWKLSAKHQELVVNVFESMVHTDLTVCIDMDAENHIGRSGDNTWEMCKDAAVSILHDQHPHTHRMQLFSQKLRIPFGRGSSHLLSLVRSVSNLKPISTHQLDPHLLRSLIPEIPYGSSLIYITPIYQNDPSQLSRVLSILQDQAVRCVVVLVDARNFSQDLPVGITFEAIGKNNIKAGETLKMILHQNGQLGVPTYVLKRGVAISRSLVMPVVN